MHILSNQLKAPNDFTQKILSLKQNLKILYLNSSRIKKKEPHSSDNDK